jgi:hypothetical protein
VALADDGSGLVIRARFSPARSGGVTGDVTLARPGTTPSSRHVVADSCAEAADAVALIIAVTLDPASAKQPEHGAGGASADARPAETAAAAAQKNGSADDASRSPPAKPKDEGTPAGATSSTEEREPKHPAGSAGRARWGLEFAGQAFVGPAPGVMPGIALYAMLGVERPSSWSPVALLGATHAWRSDLEEPGGTASFMLDAASLDACPLLFRTSVLETRPCASLLGGRLLARATATQNPASESARPFWVLGAAAVLSAKLVWRLEASARIALGANLVRDSFEFTPVVFHEVPPVSMAASLGIGLRSP